MTRDEIKNTPELVDFLLDESVIADSRKKLHERMDKICNLAIKALEQELCKDAISRQAVVDAMYELCDTGETLKENPWRDNPHIDAVIEAIEELPSVTPQQKIGHWTLIQRDKHMDISCSECGTTRFKDYAYGYTIDELNLERINDLIEKFQMNYCECCGAKMIWPSKSEDEE